jgi:hypothetical protein
VRQEVTLEHEFVQFIPDQLKEGVLYVSVEFATVAHKCCCGCGEEVVTPLSRTDWKLIFDGETISLDPSIGNWGFKCRSHYWIRRNRAIRARQWTKEEIELGRRADRGAKDKYFGKDRTAGSVSPVQGGKLPGAEEEGFWGRARRKFREWWYFGRSG